MFACLVSFFLWRINKKMRVIEVFFVLNFFKFFACARKSMSFHPYWFTKDGSFPFYTLWICFDSFMISYNPYYMLKTVVIIIFRICCCFFVFGPFRGIYVWSSMIHSCLMTLIIHYWNTIKCNVATPHPLFQIY